MKISITRDVHDKIMYWVKKSDDEVSGFGTVIEKDGDIEVIEAFLLPQTVGGAHTDIDAAGLAKLQYKVFKEKIPGELRFWWHSHAKMSVFWSGQDKATINELGGNGWIVASVFNHKEEVRTAFCGAVAVPVVGKTVHFLDELPITISNYYDSAKTAEWDKDFKECVTDKKSVPTYQGSLLYSGELGDYGMSNYKKKKTRDYSRMTDANKIKQEAKMLGLSEAEYTAILDGSASWKDQFEVQEKIDELERKGQLPNGLFY